MVYSLKGQKIREIIALQEGDFTGIKIGDRTLVTQGDPGLVLWCGME